MSLRIIEVEDSSWINGVSYDVSTRELHLHLKSGKVYIYPNIKPAAFATIITADSVGKAANAELADVPYTVE